MSWNPAQIFYKSQGAIDLTEKEGYHFYRLSCKNIKHSEVNLDSNKELSKPYKIREATVSDFEQFQLLCEVFN